MWNMDYPRPKSISLLDVIGAALTQTSRKRRIRSVKFLFFGLCGGKKPPNKFHNSSVFCFCFVFFGGVICIWQGRCLRSTNSVDNSFPSRSLILKQKKPILWMAVGKKNNTRPCWCLWHDCFYMGQKACLKKKKKEIVEFCIWKKVLFSKDVWFYMFLHQSCSLYVLTFFTLYSMRLRTGSFPIVWRAKAD